MLTTLSFNAMTTPVQIATAPQPLWLYRVVPKSDFHPVSMDGHLRLKRVGPDAWHIGLRENISDAIERAKLFMNFVDKSTHCVLAIRFTSLGLAHFCRVSAGQEYRYKSLLCKKENWGDRDFGVWHFYGDLPLHAIDSHANPLIQSEWYEIE